MGASNIRPLAGLQELIVQDNGTVEAGCQLSADLQNTGDRFYTVLATFFEDTGEETSRRPPAQRAYEPIRSLRSLQGMKTGTNNA